MRLPDFIIGGAPRAGTTWLYELLARHPDIYMARPVTPEPKFFQVDHIYEKGLAHYATWFEPAGPTQLAGEKSTNYLESADAAARIARDLPAVKLVFILREPVERAYSNYLWTRMNGIETESFEAAIALEPEREQAYSERMRFAKPYSYFSRGLYADLLTPYFAGLDRSRVLILRFEDIAQRGSAVAERLHGFLGVQPRPEDAATLGTINASEKDLSGLNERTRRELSARYAEPNRRLAAMLGPSFPVWSR